MEGVRFSVAGIEKGTIFYGRCMKGCHFLRKVDERGAFSFKMVGKRVRVWTLGRSKGGGASSRKTLLSTPPLLRDNQTVRELIRVAEGAWSF